MEMNQVKFVPQATQAAPPPAKTPSRLPGPEREQEEYELVKYHSHDFTLAPYLDTESGLQAIKKYLLAGPWSLDDSDSWFIFNDTDLRALNQTAPHTSPPKKKAPPRV